MQTNEEHKHFVRIRGLPFESKDSDVHAFFRPLNVVYVRAIITDEKSDKPPTQAYVRFESSAAATQALSKHKSMIGRRFIEIFPVNDPTELQQLSSHSLDSVIYQIGLDRFHDYEKQRRPDDGFVVKLRGLPFESTAASVTHFLLPLRVNESDLVFPNGEKKDICFVKLRSVNDVKQAMQKHRQHLNTRYIEVVPSSLRELQSSYRDEGKQDNGRSARDRSPLRGMRGARDRSPLRGISDGTKRENTYSHDDRRGYRERDSRDSQSNTSDDRIRHRGDRHSVDRSQNRDDNQGSSSRHRDNGVEGRRQREKFLAYKPRLQGTTEVDQTSVPLGSPFVTKLRGVSYHHTVDDVMQFLVPVVPEAIYIMVDYKGRASGDVFLELADASDVEIVHARHKSTMPHSKRFLECFGCNPSELYTRIDAQPVRSAPNMPKSPVFHHSNHQLHAPNSNHQLHAPNVPVLYSPPAAPVPITNLLPTVVVSVRGLPPSSVARESDVISYFSQGTATPTALHRNETEGFLEFSSDHDCHMAIQLTRFPLMGYQVETHVVNYNSMATVVGLPLRYQAPPMMQHGEPIQQHVQMQPHVLHQSGPQGQHFGGLSQHNGQHFQQQPPQTCHQHPAAAGGGTQTCPNRQYVH